MREPVKEKEVNIISDTIAEFKAKVINIGGSGAVIIPSRVFRDTRLKHGDRVRVTVELEE